MMLINSLAWMNKIFDSIIWIKKMVKLSPNLSNQRSDIDLSLTDDANKSYIDIYRSCNMWVCAKFVLD